MTYTLQTKTEPTLNYSKEFTSLGKAFEKATDLMQYMDQGSEILIINDHNTPMYSVQFVTTKKFTITELS